MLCGDTAIENVRRVVEDPDHPRNLDTSRWLLDKILPSKNQAPSVAIALQTESRYAEVAEEISPPVAKELNKPDNDNQPEIGGVLLKVDFPEAERQG